MARVTMRGLFLSSRSFFSRSEGLLGPLFFSERSSSFVSLVKAIVFPSGAQSAAPAPCGTSVSFRASPPESGSS